MSTRDYPQILLIDAFSLMFRSFYAFPPNLTLKDGTPINGVYGFITLLFKALEQYNPDYLCVCFDRKEPNFRMKIYDQYKAHRPPPPDEFKVQVPHLLEILDKLNIIKKDCPSYEADDIIGTLTKLADNNKIDSLIMTGDHDAFQLVSNHTSVIMNKKGDPNLFTYTPEEIQKRFDLTVSQMIDFKALKGDPSDNIPGVKGVGEKTATNLLKEYNDLDGIYKNLENIKSNSVKTKLETDKKMAYTSQKLVTIERNVPIDIDFEEFHYNPNWEQILEVFKEYDFETLYRRYLTKTDPNIGEDQSSQTQKPDGTYQAITDKTSLKHLLPLMKKGFAIDLETTGKEALEAQIVGIAIAITEKKAYYIPLNDYVTQVQETTLSLFDTGENQASPFKSNPFLDILKPILEDETIPKYTQNGKYEIEVFHNYNIALKGITFDTMIAAFLLYPLENIGLKALTERHLNIAMTHYEDVAGKGKSAIPFQDVPIEEATNYAAADADFTLRLTNLFKPKIEEEYKDLYYNIELPTQDALAEMEINGVTIDTNYLHKLHTEFEREQTELAEEIYKDTGETFNINSPKQVGAILYEKMGLPVLKKTKTGASTDSSVLEKLKDDHPVAGHLLNYRMYTKLLSTYVDALPKLKNPYTGKIHTSFNQCIAATGRLSSTNPNLQNIPIRTEQGIRLRKAFIPSTQNGKIISADYSQIELRVLAHLANDAHMVEAFKRGEDIHASTAALVFHVPYDEVTKEQRYRAKAVNFGISYGQGAFTLAEQLKISRSEAKDIIDAYYGKFSSIKTYIEETVKDARRTGKVETLFGRIRPIPEINSSNRQRQNMSERIAVNTTIQGTAADIMKIAMLKVAAEMKAQKLNSKLIIQVHDELVFDVLETELSQLKSLIKAQMESAVELSLPLKIDLAQANNWMDAG